MSDERIARLEQRLEVLESLVRQLLAQGTTPPPIKPEAITQPRPTGVRLPPRPIPPPPPLHEADEARAELLRRSKPRAAPLFTEEWLGQKGLLAVGVIFLVLAAGYLLKLSFDRDWISPAVRCTGGALAGVAVAALGWRLHRKGTQTYGAALIGAGASIIYIAVWAAARLYEFLPPTPAIISLALIAAALAAIAYALDLEALGATSALGAYFAPILIGHDSGNANLLLIYLITVGVGLGSISAYRKWRIAFGLVALAYFGMATHHSIASAAPALLYLYAILGGAAGLFVGLREQWFETRLLAFGGGWGVLSVADRNGDVPWMTLIGAVILTLPVWWRGLTRQTVWPDRERGALPQFGDSLYFYLTPMLLATALYQVAPDGFDDNKGLLPAIIAVPYLIAGFTAVRRPFAIVGVAALVLASAIQFEPLTAALVNLGLALLFVVPLRLLQREDSIGYSLFAFGVSILLLLGALDHRASGSPSFVDLWALALWGSVLVAGFLARTFRDRSQLAQPLWIVAGVILLLGMTGELWRHFGEQQGSSLAGGLAVSAWWILYAAGCFFAGFRMHLKPLRVAGFVVAGCALAKVLLIDLSTLDAFYRIGSALILGIVCLSVAYVYHRARNSAPAA